MKVYEYGLYAILLSNGKLRDGPGAHTRAPRARLFKSQPAAEKEADKLRKSKHDLFQGCQVIEVEITAGELVETSLPYAGETL